MIRFARSIARLQRAPSRRMNLRKRKSPSKRCRRTTERTDLPLLLVVDDEPDMRRYLVTMLRESYRIIEAEDGISALEKAMTADPRSHLARCHASRR